MVSQRAKGNRGGQGGAAQFHVKSSTSLISAREEYQTTVDDTLQTARDMYDQYGIQVNDFQLSVLGGRDGSRVMGYSNGDDIGLNMNHVTNKRMDKAYDKSVQSGYHPKRGEKSATQAVVAHEIGHNISMKVARKAGHTSIDKASSDIIKRAEKNTKRKNVGKNISGYAKTSAAEAVAEAFCDVYCNGSNAHKDSIAIVNAAKSLL